MRRTARGFLVVVLIGIAIVGFVVLVSAATYLDALIPTQIPVATAIVNVLRSVPFLILLAIGGGPGGLPVPAAHAPHAGDRLLIPAILVGVVVVVLTQIFTLLVPRLVGVAALAGSLASAFIALAWLSFTFQALLYGAAWVRVRDETADRAAGGVSRAGRSRTAGRTERWRRVTARS